MWLSVEYTLSHRSLSISLSLSLSLSLHKAPSPQSSSTLAAEPAGPVVFIHVLLGSTWALQMPESSKTMSSGGGLQLVSKSQDRLSDGTVSSVQLRRGLTSELPRVSRLVGLSRDPLSTHFSAANTHTDTRCPSTAIVHLQISSD